VTAPTTGHPTTVTAPTVRVVLVDVRSERRAVMRVMLDHALGEGTVVAEITKAAEVAASLDRHEADVAVVEIQLPLAEGLATVAALRAARPSLRIVVCSFLRDAVAQAEALKAGADCYLAKPVSSRDLRRALDPDRSTLEMAG
jgi:DNA-binding NarL/FixJ family response regulator